MIEKVIILKEGSRDVVSETIWTEENLKEVVKKLGIGYRYDECERAVVWEGEVERYSNKSNE